MLLRSIRDGRWPTVAGYALFIGMMSVGYYYNVTFVQLGLKDLGEGVLGLSSARVAWSMALLAVVTVGVALWFGALMSRRGWSQRFRVKLRIAFLVVLAQTVLTAAALLVASEAAYVAWILAASLALGVGVPATFAMSIDLIPVVDRGWVAGAIAGVAYLAANTLPGDWTLAAFATQMLVLMPPGAVALGVLAYGRFGWLDRLAEQHRDPAFGLGRFVRLTPGGAPRRDRTFLLVVILMFGIFFVDSLGFLRMIDAPELMTSSWRSVDPGPRTLLGVTHLAAALIGGVLYQAFPARHLFFWAFGIFALVHFSYALAPGGASGDALGIPMLYAVAVSLYTVVNFAVWADFSTPATIGWNAALGVAFSGWSATFLSTALALSLQRAGVPLADHLRYVDAVALLFFAAMLVLLIVRPGRAGRAPS